ncbi:50S ribosomal protein L29 [Candidatus Daviesbacteria bacterium RIFOXYD1_FULL_41_10]|uniref:Large ribosomal subunit protein uL29 n=2 Tax=Candidatus Daviesiibacteriota TaxID=1752718 RepID=A0A1F5MZD6_9BACT|nr:MAG: 50S ribosomal protein L29P [Candidatus Daviesbacteria bacterium GW2011_GWB1_41_5]OGE70600.1 MAG: 50S ribosomal protein L29 [Candidatus Daviesbacteria bacterium RIFOXYD1_FULL_41_10]
MKRNDFAEIKKMELKPLLERVKKERQELAGLILEQGQNKLKDLKTVQKRKRNIARMLTVISQKEQLSELEVENKQSLKF